MARTVKARVYVLVEVEEIDTLLGAEQTSSRLLHRILYDRSFETGTTDTTQLDRVWSSSAEIAAGTPRDVDLIGGETSQLNGLTTSFVDWAIMCIENQESAGDVQVGGDANGAVGWISAAATNVSVKPNGILLWVAPAGVLPVAGTGDIVQLAASAGTITTKALFAGRSA